MGTAANLLSEGNLALLRQVGEEYAAYKASGGRITKGQYDHRRRVLVRQFAENMGPVERWLFRGASTQEAVRIARAGGVPYDHHIQQHSGRLRGLAKAAGVGGILLTGVGLTAACVQIAHTVDRNEKNQIFVETVSSTVFSGVGGLVVGLYLVSNPVGWGTALVLAATLAGSSALVGEGFRALYDHREKQLDLVDSSGIEALCKT
ncbi:MAG: hypothetical protein ACK4ZD_13495 [Caldimonas sp.]|uniref:hypothetical protein n=1 Tax=Caldimonas sp. TaxID=2838790 RepID=UPI0039189B26